MRGEGLQTGFILFYVQQFFFTIILTKPVIFLVQVIICASAEAAAEFREAYGSQCSPGPSGSDWQTVAAGPLHASLDVKIVNTMWVLDCISSFSELPIGLKLYKL